MIGQFHKTNFRGQCGPKGNGSFQKDTNTQGVPANKGCMEQTCCHVVVVVVVVAVVVVDDDDDLTRTGFYTQKILHMPSRIAVHISVQTQRFLHTKQVFFEKYTRVPLDVIIYIYTWFSLQMLFLYTSTRLLSIIKQCL